MLTKYLLLSLAAIAAAAARTSSDGKCGGRHQLTCEGSGYGDCCSQYSYCGSSRAYCGKGCQNDFGSCGGDSPALKVSQDGSCGNGVTCNGSKYGNCCSQYNYCGSNKDYCDKGCQLSFGTCKAISSSPAARSSTQAPSSSSTRARLSSSTSARTSSSTSARTSSSASVSTSSSSSRVSIVSSPSPSSSVASSPVVSSTFTPVPATSSTPVSSIVTPSSVMPSTVSSSLVVSSTSSCVIPAATNALINGGFETGSLPPWTAINNGYATFGGDAPVVQTYAGYGAESSNSFYQTVQRAQGQVSYSLTQTNVLILSGTTVSCSAYLLTIRNPGFMSTFVIRVDDVVCATMSAVDQESWLKFTGNNIVVTGDTHTVTVTWTSNGVDEAGSVDEIDQISVLPVAGPGVPSTC